MGRGGGKFPAATAPAVAALVSTSSLEEKIACHCFVWLLALPAIRHVEAATKDCISFQAKETPQLVKARRSLRGKKLVVLFSCLQDLSVHYVARPSSASRGQDEAQVLESADPRRGHIELAVAKHWLL